MHSKTITHGGFIGVLINTVSKVFTLINRERWFKCLGVSCTPVGQGFLKSMHLMWYTRSFPHRVLLGRIRCHIQSPPFHTAIIVSAPVVETKLGVRDAYFKKQHLWRRWEESGLGSRRWSVMQPDKDQAAEQGALEWELPLGGRQTLAALPS